MRSSIYSATTDITNNTSSNYNNNYNRHSSNLHSLNQREIQEDRRIINQKLRKHLSDRSLDVDGDREGREGERERGEGREGEGGDGEEGGFINNSYIHRSNHSHGTTTATTEDEDEEQGRTGRTGRGTKENDDDHDDDDDDDGMNEAYEAMQTSLYSSSSHQHNNNNNHNYHLHPGGSRQDHHEPSLFNIKPSTGISERREMMMSNNINNSSYRSSSSRRLYAGGGGGGGGGGGNNRGILADGGEYNGEFQGVNIPLFASFDIPKTQDMRKQVQGVLYIMLSVAILVSYFFFLESCKLVSYGH